MKVAILYDFVREYGGGYIHAWYTAKALRCPIMSVVVNKSVNVYGFLDLFYKVPKYLLALDRLKVTLARYLIFSSLQIPDLENYDAVITFTYAKALMTPDTVAHINYVLSPIRFIYSDKMRRIRNKKSFISRELFRYITDVHMYLDRLYDKNVDYYISNSEVIKRRLWKYLKRDSVVVHPPIEVNKYKFNGYGGYFLYISRLYPEKRPIEVIKAFLKLRDNLVVVGDGLLRREVESLANKYPNIRYLGKVSEDKKIELLSNCTAVIFPAENEDFGLVPIEALASGKPIIVDNSGYPKLLVEKYKCGVIADCSKVTDIIRAVNRIKLLINADRYDPNRLIEIAKNFDYEVFRDKIRRVVKEFIRDYNEKAVV